MIIYFDTVKRKRPVKEGGELVKMDWNTKKILKHVPVFPFDPDIDDDPNPRGNSRGGKGIVVTGEELYVGTYHSILVFDFDLHLKRKISHNLFVNIHEMCLDKENIWVSSTAVDCALLVTPEGKTIKSWWPREETLLQEKYGLQPMDIDKTSDNRLIHIHAELSTKPHHTHLNSVVKYGCRIYALLNKLGIVVQVEPELKIAVDDPAVRGAHSPVISTSGDRLLLCSSIQKCIMVYDLESGKTLNQIDLLNFPVIAKLYQTYPDQPFNRSIFARGLEIIDDHRILAGISPAAVLEIDIHKNQLLDFFQYSTEVGDAVHGLAIKNVMMNDE
ncbi:MAG: hypothetical protein MUF15_05720 [Acidobacteria bacterium]|jgi:hypothetical protein|nr:hypothetical protein [Acidobacteriota bacterium]